MWLCTTASVSFVVIFHFLYSVMASQSEGSVVTSQGNELADCDGKNLKTVVCPRCRSVVLRPGTAKYDRASISLPPMTVEKEKDHPCEEVQLYDVWLVDDMFTFENVGFSNTVGSMKYLTCADCEVGPIGWQDLTKPTEIYVAHERVLHE